VKFSSIHVRNGAGAWAARIAARPAGSSDRRRRRSFCGNRENGQFRREIFAATLRANGLVFAKNQSFKLVLARVA